MMYIISEYYMEKLCKSESTRYNRLIYKEK